MIRKKKKGITFRGIPPFLFLTELSEHYSTITLRATNTMLHDKIRCVCKTGLLFQIIEPELSKKKVNCVEK